MYAQTKDYIRTQQKKPTISKSGSCVRIDYLYLITSKKTHQKKKKVIILLPEVLDIICIVWGKIL